MPVPPVLFVLCRTWHVLVRLERFFHLFRDHIPQFRSWTKRTASTRIAAQRDQIVFSWHTIQRLARQNKVQSFGARILVENEPAKSLLVCRARRNLPRDVSLDVVAGFIELRIRINHDHRTIVRGVEDVEITVRIRLQQHAHAIAFLKHMLGIDANRQSV